MASEQVVEESIDDSKVSQCQVGKGNDLAVVALDQLFDAKFYSKQIDQLQLVTKNLLTHYREVGHKALNPHPLFDTAYYISRYPDWIAYRTPLEHFLRMGRELQLNPCALFDSSYYLSQKCQHPSFSDNPLVHFLEHGSVCGINPHPLFDVQYYNHKYPDVAAHDVNPLVHYVRFGGVELRKPCALFDSAYYIHLHKIQLADSMTPLGHYLVEGGKRGLEPNEVFDTAFYLSQLSENQLIGTATALEHYFLSGRKRGVQPHPLFDPVYYEQNSSALQGHSEPLGHFLESGAREGKDPHALFDTKFYLSAYEHVVKDNFTPLQHFLKIGFAKDRSPSPFFDAIFYKKQYGQFLEGEANCLIHFLKLGKTLGFAPYKGFYENRISADKSLSSSAEMLQELMHDAHAWKNRGHLKSDQMFKPPAAPAPKTMAPGAAPTFSDWQLLKEKLASRQVGLPVVDVVVPIYRGFDESLLCLFSVLDSVNETPFELIVINDRSPELNLVKELQRLSAEGLFTFLSNEENLGFPRTANRGMSLHKDRDVVLLNADTVVYENWLDRLRSACYRGKNTATVTPLSNNATICSYPHRSKNNCYELELAHKELDALSAQYNNDKLVDLPTAVGFCMYVRRQCIEEVGYFDCEKFSRGYGEENDFCCRAKLLGWRHVLAGNIFVSHIGSVSYADEEPLLKNTSLAKLMRTYPTYEDELIAFSDADPIRAIRAELDLARLKKLTSTKSVLFITHGLGGGTEKHVQYLANRWEKLNIRAFILRAYLDDADEFKVRIEHAFTSETPNLVFDGLEKDYPEILRVLKSLRVAHAHCHHLLGFGQAAPNLVARLTKDLGVAYDFTIHDYMTICPRIYLVDQSNKYCGEPDERGCANCLSRDELMLNSIAIGDWRDRYQKLLRGARRVFVPSVDVKQRLERYFSGLNIAVKPHAEEIVQEVIPTPKSNAKLRVAIIGTLTTRKGLEVVFACASHALKEELPIEFILFGSLESTNPGRFMRLPNLKIMGPYSDNKIYELLKNNECDVAFFPAVWPETFSYTLSIALRARLFPVCFELGAIAERINALGWGMVLAQRLFDDPAEVNAKFLQILRDRHAQLYPSGSLVCDFTYSDLFADYYGSDLALTFRENS